MTKKIKPIGEVSYDEARGAVVKFKDHDGDRCEINHWKEGVIFIDCTALDKDMAASLAARLMLWSETGEFEEGEVEEVDAHT